MVCGNVAIILPLSSHGHLPWVSVPLYPNFPFVRRTPVNWIKAYPTPVEHYLNVTTFAKTLFPDRITFTDTGRLGLRHIFLGDAVPCMANSGYSGGKAGHDERPWARCVNSTNPPREAHLVDSQQYLAPPSSPYLPCTTLHFPFYFSGSFSLPSIAETSSSTHPLNDCIALCFKPSLLLHIFF